MKAEHRQLEHSLVPLDEYVDVLPFQKTLSNFSALAGEAQPIEIQQMLRCVVRRIKWQPSGEHVVDFYGAKRSGGKKIRRGSEAPRLVHPSHNWLKLNDASTVPTTPVANALS